MLSQPDFLFDLLRSDQEHEVEPVQLWLNCQQAGAKLRLVQSPPFHRGHYSLDIELGI